MFAPPRLGLSRSAVIPLTLLLVATAPPSMCAQERPDAVEARLGHTDFPNSGPPEARRPFLEGVLLLHSFEYEAAAEAFREAREIAPDFALAYWGEAMTHNHPVWFSQDRETGGGILKELGQTPEERRAKAPTERERAYLEAVEILFGDGDKARRDTLYSEAMRTMHQRWPEDENAAAFYALSILGTSHGGRDVPTYMRAAAVAEEVFQKNPDHPGAVHYLIHSYDDPVHAPLGLRPARRYSEIAGDAPHAQHMTTHIFVAMGMWDDVVSQNQIAAGPDPERWVPGHYTWWLGYGYLQQGRYRDAAALLESLHSGMREEANPGRVAHLVRMRAELVANTGQWNHPALDWDLDPAAGDRSSLGYTSSLLAADAYVRGRAALERCDPEDATERADALAAVFAAAEAAANRNDPTPGVARVMELQLRGLVERHRARTEGPGGHGCEAGRVPGGEHGDGGGDEHGGGLALLEEALALEQSLPYEFGPPLVVIPSGELLGQVLLEEGRAVESMLAFQTALETAPGRASSLLGLARAAELAGESERATRAYSRLHANWHSADPGIPGREETSDYIEANRLGAATNRRMSNGGGRKLKLTNSDENSP